MCEPWSNNLTNFCSSGQPSRARLLSARRQLAEALRTGDRLQLMCRVSGRPAPLVTWLKDGLPVVTSASNRIQIVKLRFVNSFSFGIRCGTVEPAIVLTFMTVESNGICL
jgi:Immunoglobulin domain